MSAAVSRSSSMQRIFLCVSAMRATGRLEVRANRTGINVPAMRPAPTEGLLPTGPEGGSATGPLRNDPMPQPHSIRFHLAAVFLLFFLLVVVLGMFSIWRLSNFNRLSADVAEVWLPNTRALGDLNNFTSDFRAIEGSNLLSSEAADIAATERQMADLDRAIADAERGFERIRRDAAGNALYATFKQRWNDYRAVVNQIVALSHANRKSEALAIYAGASRAAY